MIIGKLKKINCLLFFSGNIDDHLSMTNLTKEIDHSSYDDISVNIKNHMAMVDNLEIKYAKGFVKNITSADSIANETLCAMLIYNCQVYDLYRDMHQNH